MNFEKSFFQLATLASSLFQTHSFTNSTCASKFLGSCQEQTSATTFTSSRDRVALAVSEGWAEANKCRQVEVVSTKALWNTNSCMHQVMLNLFMSYCRIISSIILGGQHENLFTFFFLPRVIKKNKLLWNFLNEITKPFTNYNSKMSSLKFASK